MKKDRYVLVAFDKYSGHIYVATEMLREVFSKAEVQEVIKFTPKAMKELRDFHIMSYEKAVSLWVKERNESGNKDKRILN